MMTAKDTETTYEERMDIGGTGCDGPGRRSGQRSATFVSTSINETQIVFENAAHDFPQQIGYRLKDGALLAWIAGSMYGKARRVEFPYVRAACVAR